MIWVLVDVSYLAYRAMHTLSDLSFEDLATGVVFGFFTQLRQICIDGRINSNQVIIFADSRESKRRLVYPEYKHKRRTSKKTAEEIDKIREMRRQLDVLTGTILPRMGFPVYSQEGLESDDLIAWTARHLTMQGCIEGHNRRQAVMVTADGDLFQSITTRVHWYDPGRNIYHTPETFYMLKGVTCRQWARVKTLSGCRTDNVAGVPGVAEPTAIKYLQGDIPPSRKVHQSIISDRGRSIEERNRGLVVLPHVETSPIVLRPPVFDEESFFFFCERYGLMSIIRERETWLKFLRGTAFPKHRKYEAQSRSPSRPRTIST